LFRILQGYLKCFKVIKFKRNLKKLILISLYDTSSIVETFKIIKFKINFKKSNYDFCFGFLNDSLNVLKL
jgi:hypothetical protein